MALADRAVTAATKQAERPAIVRYVGEILLHVFMTRGGKDADGKFVKREPTGEVALVYRILPVLADGTTTTSGAIWLWLEQARKADAPMNLDPALLRAFRSSLSALAKDIDEVEADAVESGDWKPLATKAAAEAPKLKGMAARAAKQSAAATDAKAAAEADGAKAVDLEAAVNDLPF